jgi:hypothetical protein
MQVAQAAAASKAPRVIVDGMRWQQAVRTRNFWVCNLNCCLPYSVLLHI